MQLLLNLYLGHLIGDFMLQPGRLVAAKRKGAAGLLIHASIIAATTALILWADLSALWSIVLLATAAHLLIELITIRARSVERMNGLSVFIIDQGLHILSLIALVSIAHTVVDVDRIRTFGFDLSPAWTALACALVGVTFLGSILIFELVNVIGPPSRRREILPYDTERVLGMVERGGALLAATLLPGMLDIAVPVVSSALLVAAFVPRAAYALLRPPEERAYQMLVAAGGLTLTALAYLFVAGVTLLTAP